MADTFEPLRDYDDDSFSIGSGTHASDSHLGSTVDDESVESLQLSDELYKILHEFRSPEAVPCHSSIIMSLRCLDSVVESGLSGDFCMASPLPHLSSDLQVEVPLPLFFHLVDSSLLKPP